MTKVLLIPFALALLAAPTACSEPTRPELPVTEHAEIEVLVLGPPSGQSVIAGQPFTLTVRGSEPGQRLNALGYVVRMSGDTSSQDSLLVSFPPVRDTIAAFPIVVPDTFARPVYIFVTALGAAGAQVATSTPHPLTVLHCTGAPAWCP